MIGEKRCQEPIAWQKRDSLEFLWVWRKVKEGGGRSKNKTCRRERESHHVIEVKKTLTLTTAQMEQ